MIMTQVFSFDRSALRKKYMPKIAAWADYAIEDLTQEAKEQLWDIVNDLLGDSRAQEEEEILRMCEHCGERPVVYKARYCAECNSRKIRVGL